MRLTLEQAKATIARMGMEQAFKDLLLAQWIKGYQGARFTVYFHFCKQQKAR